MTEITVIDYSRIGKKGFPMHPEAYPDIPLPTKEVPSGEPVKDGETNEAVD